MASNHKGEEPVGWVTVKGVHFPKWKDGTIGWDNGEEKLSSHSQHDFQKAIREAKTKEDISKIIKEAGNSGLSEEAMNKVMGTAYDRGQELKESTQSKLSGEVSFNDLMRATRDTNHIHFDKVVSYSLKGKNPPYGDNKKRDLVDRLNEYKVNDVVVDMYRDKSGANDLKRMQDAGFEIQAYYKGKNQGNIPARDYYYMKRKNTSASETVSKNSRYDTSRSNSLSPRIERKAGLVFAVSKDGNVLKTWKESEYTERKYQNYLKQLDKNNPNKK